MALLSSYFARCPPPHSAVPFTGLFRPWLATNRSPITVQTVDITVAFRKLRETSRQVENTPTYAYSPCNLPALASSRGIYCACPLSLSLSLWIFLFRVTRTLHPCWVCCLLGFWCFNRLCHVWTKMVLGEMWLFVVLTILWLGFGIMLEVN